MQQIENAQLEQPHERSSVVRPWLMLHGTMQSYDLKESRRFYEQFLGLECVRQGKPAIFIRCGMKWHIVVVQAGNHLKPAHLHQHWGLEVGSREEVDDAFRKANEEWRQYRDAECARRPDHAPKDVSAEDYQLPCTVVLTRRRAPDMRSASVLPSTCSESPVLPVGEPPLTVTVLINATPAAV